MFLNGIESFLSLSGFLTYACKYAEALRLDEDLSFFALFASYLVSVRIICSDEPFSVPTCIGIKKDLIHLGNGCTNLGSLIGKSLEVAEIGILITVLNKHTADEY